MTKEQEEAIDRLRKITNRQILYGNKYGITIEGFREVQEDIETVLNMLKEKDAEIEHLKENINYQTLCDFLISSVTADTEPVWTEKHIEEVLSEANDRYR